ncbi:ATP-binding protein [Youngiibacter fragilis]|uniref:ATPase n=1 Tax=Youngiibacter fragilis 232.1 TaxID=994573 RepID=V7I072_9CLOT|nr:ATP-binding protein [Youngiibacter fragilis]ETA79288.1 ATPase [Youngiibacter fragilis 232.1]
MYRSAMKKLKAWKAKVNRKPLIIRGARQVGKTWLMKEFGANEYENVVYINFDNNERMSNLFEGSLEVERLVTGLELYSGHKIDPQDTLLIFDEIQEVPKALTSLKYFHENAPQYNIICAGSLLGIALHHGTSFPVGKVEFLDMYPMSFLEFIHAMGKDQHAALLEKGDFEMANTFNQDFIDLLKQYYFIGGMPEVVHDFSRNRDFNMAREIQKHILDAYEQDFSKHAPNNVVPSIRMLWNSIPAQLAKENKKFIYGLIKEGARAKEYEIAMLWLTDCGLVHKIQRVVTPSLPLKAYEDLKAFKLYLLDVGLLSCMTGLRQVVLLEGNNLFREFKGALTEQYVLQQLKTLDGIDTYYWSAERGTSEVDFVIDNGTYITPLEVKAAENLQSKSMKVYRDKYKPNMSIRTSMADYRRDDWLLNLPLWAVETIR